MSSTINVQEAICDLSCTSVSWMNLGDFCAWEIATICAHAMWDKCVSSVYIGDDNYCRQSTFTVNVH